MLQANAPVNVVSRARVKKNVLLSVLCVQVLCGVGGRGRHVSLCCLGNTQSSHCHNSLNTFLLFYDRLGVLYWYSSLPHNVALVGKQGNGSVKHLALLSIQTLLIVV